jgi:hypothetical protein
LKFPPMDHCRSVGRGSKSRPTNLQALMPGILFAVALIVLMMFVPQASGDGDREEYGKRHGKSASSSFSRGKRGDKGNEFTGQSAAWIFAAANLTVGLSLLSRGLTTRPQLSSRTKERIRKLNQIQKKGLMRFHYWLNPLGLLLAVIHFSLSTCRSSPFPEWGLVGAATLVLIGSVIRFKLSPKRFRKTVYRIHTSPLSVGLVLIVLLIGHSIVD